MKIRICTVMLMLGLYATYAQAQRTYKNKPLIFSGIENIDVGIGRDWYSGQWRISPQTTHDTLNLKIYGKSESVAFRTDKDSIRLNVKLGETKSFYIKWADKEPAYTLVTAKPFPWDFVPYGTTGKNKNIQIFYEKPNLAYFDSLRREYPLTKVLKNDKTDKEKVLSILNWTHHQWKHDGNNSPKGNDAISILNEVKAGGRFPCFAYAIVLRDQLIAHGYKARTLYLKTKDASTRKGSPGHVATEVYLNDLKKWVFIDGQFNVMPTLNGKPLNAVEFQQALSHNYENVVLASRDKIYKSSYVAFVYDYLYYFDTALDNRHLPAAQSFKLDGKRSLMLVPMGAPNLTKIDFWNSKVDYCVYTNSMQDFYAVPN